MITASEVSKKPGAVHEVLRELDVRAGAAAAGAIGRGVVGAHHGERFPNASFLREWDARGYDRVAETMSAWSRAAGPGRALLLERAGITPGQRVLDLCSGPSWLAIEAARAVAPDGHACLVLKLPEPPG